MGMPPRAFSALVLLMPTVVKPQAHGTRCALSGSALVSTDTHLVNNYEWRDLALLFTVANQDKPFFIGTTWAPPIIAIDP